MRRRPLHKNICRTAPILALLLPASCQVGPNALRVSQTEYSDAIQQASAEQLLLNLVRLKYRELPLILDIGTVSAQFEITHTGGVSGTLNENVGQAVSHTAATVGSGATGSFSSTAGRISGSNPDSLNLFGQFAYSERPTLTFSPLRGEDFVKRMMSPISLDTIVLLSNAGWRIDRVFRVVIQELNGIDNAGAASGPTPDIGPDFKNFVQACDAMRSLQLDRAIWLERMSVPKEMSDPISADKITPEALVDAAAAGESFRRTSDGTNYVLTKDEIRYYLRIAERETSAEALRTFRSILKLAPDQTEYELEPTRKAGHVNAAGLHTKIAVDTRSLLGVMFFLSQAIHSPPSDREAGIITKTMTKSGEPYDWSRAIGDFMDIRFDQWPPRGAAVAVRHRGYWFYIADDDLTSKSTFMLLSQVFRLQAGSGKATSPVLTLPVGR